MTEAKTKQSRMSLVLMVAFGLVGGFIIVLWFGSLPNTPSRLAAVGDVEGNSSIAGSNGHDELTDSEAPLAVPTAIVDPAFKGSSGSASSEIAQEEVPGTRQKVIAILSRCKQHLSNAKYGLLTDECARLREIMTNLPEQVAYSILASLELDDLAAFGKTWNFASDGQGGQAIDQDRLEKYPPGLLPFMLDAARGSRGEGGREAAMWFFEYCRDCPLHVYEYAVETLSRSTSTELLYAALTQIDFSSPANSPGGAELAALIRGETDPEIKRRAMQTLARRDDSHQVLLDLLRNGDDEEIALATHGLSLHFQRGSFGGPRAENRVTEEELWLAVDSVYLRLPRVSKRDAADALASIPTAELSAQGLQSLAAQETDDRLRNLLNEASSMRKDQGPNRTVMHLLENW